ncbi:MAG: hypothetical protein KatS3mg111_1463 [Pirellulaceae bacterium]|nr:MAG: hypothetical protein KatS3mg111_1463 [Pirellulaceae bacterium]
MKKNLIPIVVACGTLITITGVLHAIGTCNQRPAQEPEFCLETFVLCEPYEEDGVNKCPAQSENPEFLIPGCEEKLALPDGCFADCRSTGRPIKCWQYVRCDEIRNIQKEVIGCKEGDPVGPVHYTTEFISPECDPPEPCSYY